MMLIYLAYPIDSNDGHHDIGVDGLIARSGLAVYDPSTAFRRAGTDPERAYAINEAALREADGVLAVLPDGVASVGVPMEIQTAYDSGKPVVATGGVASRSMQLKGMGVAVEPTVTQAIDRLCQLMAEARIERYRIKYTGEPEYEPQKGYLGDAGYDLIVSRNEVIWPGEFIDVPCGVSIELPGGVWAMITGRSSTLRKRQLLVSQGVIDQGYRGPLFAGVWNLGREKAEVREGERIAQLIPFPQTSLRLTLERVDELDPSDRGRKGFGSTGV